MEIFIPVIAILCTFGVGPAIMYLRGRHKLEERRLELEARNGGSGADARRLTEENKLLRERVENLESIVCSVDFELNQKLAKVIDEQRSLLLPAIGQTAATGSGSSPGAVGASPAGGSAGSSNRLAAVRDTPVASPAALDRTATAAAVRAAPITATLEPGQV